jgi:hypothetical protein
MRPTLSTHECISLIASIFSDRNQVKVVEGLSGDDAQNFIDVIDTVRTAHSHLSPPGDRSSDASQTFTPCRLGIR